MGMCGKVQSSVKEELKLENIFFTHKKTHMFIKSQLKNRTFYLVWLVIAAAWHVAVLCADIAVDVQRNNNTASARWFLYLSNWTYLLLIVMILWDLAVVIYANVKAEHLFGTEFGGTAVMPWYLKVNWILHVLGTDTSLTVAIIHWICLDPSYNWDDYFFNLVNAIFAFVHLILGRKPSRIYHFYLSAAFFSTYVSFTKTYQIISNEPIYSTLDWSKVPEVYKLALPLSLCAGLIAHVITHVLHETRSRCFWPKNREIDEIDQETPPPTPRTLVRMKAEDDIEKTGKKLDKLPGGRPNVVVPLNMIDAGKHSEDNATTDASSPP